MIRRLSAALAALATLAGAFAAASTAAAAAPTRPPAAATSSATAGGGKTTAAAASLVFNMKWELYYGSGYSGDKLVWSNRNPTWQVGDASTRMTFKPNCGQAITVINKGTTYSTPTSGNTPCSMTYSHTGEIYETQHGGAIIFRTGYNPAAIYYYTALQLVTNTATGERWGCWNMYDWNGSYWNRWFMATNPGGVCENSV